MYDSTNADESRMINKQKQHALNELAITDCRKYLNAMLKMPSACFILTPVYILERQATK